MKSKRTKSRTMSSRDKGPTDFLLEIGCEELPADYMPAIVPFTPDILGPQSLVGNVQNIFNEKGIKWSQIQGFGTPRRLILKISGVEPVVREVIEGPPVSVAFDAQGKPTEAAAGFAKRQGVSLSQLMKKETSRSARLVLERDIPVEEVMKQVIPLIISNINFPKTMRWDSSGVRFARPIRWILALYGSEIVECVFGSIKSGRITYGNRRLGDKSKTVRTVSNYFTLLPQLKIVLHEGPSLPKRTELHGDDEKRTKREILLDNLRSEATKIGGHLEEETEEFIHLLNTAVFLAEDPFVATGSFQKNYNDLPAEVLATSMAKHLKLFSVQDGKGRLFPNFLAVLEGKPKNPVVVMAHIGRILNARFSDARFFYDKDTEKRLKEKVSQLSGVVFHEKLGSVAERIPRLKRIMETVCEQLKVPAPIMYMDDAAELCKADLVTQMVREFPSLQGIIGAYYCDHDGEAGDISLAIAQHYLPRSSGDSIPATSLGAVLGVADRVDMLIGYFGIGLKPSGSADPYGLRRQALGLVRILIEFKSPFDDKKLFFSGLSIDSVLDVAIESWGSRLTVKPETLKKEVRGFLKERFEWIAFVVRQFGKSDRELTAAVLGNEDNDLKSNDLAEAWHRLTILRQMWGTGPTQSPLLIKAAKVAERTGRMIASVKEKDGLSAVRPEAFTEVSEKELWESWSRIKPILEQRLSGREFEKAIEVYGSLYPVVHQFFEKVFVMDENKEVQRNRLSLLKEIFDSLSSQFADLSKLPLSGVELS